NGPPLRETFKMIDQDRAEEMIATYREHNLLNHDNYVTPFPHVVETIQELEKHGFNLGIDTTKMEKSVEKGLAITALKPCVQIISSLDEVHKAVANAESVIKAMEELHGGPESALMIGDNSHDIEAGDNAGVLTAGVSWAQRGESFLQQFAPTYMLKDTRELLNLVLEKS